MVVVAVPAGEGTRPIQIELEEAPRTDLSDIYDEEATRSVREKVMKLAEPLFSEAVDLVRSCAAEVKRKLDEMPEDTRPDELELQFAVKLDAKVGAAIVESTSGAQLQISMRWNGRKNA
ncbi:hypothetical protein OG589_18045 [Sphaerisporangium sp. NBC_01403]|uniref:CU044_2847 family protein n=1 Tax=Sphaerisporangium sp. NBC_01403 TaxID=2903599 RepID=UPI00324D7B8C